MTTLEARKILKLRPEDEIHKEGVEALLDIIEAQLSVWSIGNTERAKLEKEKEACLTLLK